MGVSRVDYGDETLIDLTLDTVSADNLLNGVTAHSADGEEVVGNVITHNVIDNLTSDSSEDALSAKQGKVLNSQVTILNADFTDLDKNVIKKELIIDKDGIATRYTQFDILDLSLKQGSISSTGAEESSSTRIRTSSKLYSSNGKVDYVFNTSAYNFNVKGYDENDSIVYSSPAWITTNGSVTCEDAKYFRFVIKKVDGSTISPSDISSGDFNIGTMTNYSFVFPTKEDCGIESNGTYTYTITPQNVKGAYNSSGNLNTDTGFFSAYISVDGISRVNSISGLIPHSIRGFKSRTPKSSEIISSMTVNYSGGFDIPDNCRCISVNFQYSKNSFGDFTLNCNSVKNSTKGNTYGGVWKSVNPFDSNGKAILYERYGKGLITNISFAGDEPNYWVNYENATINVYTDNNLYFTGKIYELCGMGMSLGESTYSNLTFYTPLFGKLGIKNSVWMNYKIPYYNHIKVEIVKENASDLSTKCFATVRDVTDIEDIYIGGIKLPKGAYLHSKRVADTVVQQGNEYEILNTQNNGIIVANMLFASSVNQMFLEGCLRGYYGDSVTPEIMSSGFEDYFLFTHFFDVGAKQYPNTGITLLDNSNYKYSCYRIHLDDLLMFKEGGFKLKIRNNDQNSNNFNVNSTSNLIGEGGDATLGCQIVWYEY